MTTNETFPFINACLNSLATIFLLFGWVFIRQKKINAHKKAMALAVTASALFLSSYLWYHFHYTSPKFEAQGFVRIIYFSILISHVFLSVLVLPFIFRILWLSYKNRFQEHKTLARYVWPIWMYNSITGVLVYLMLYVWFRPSVLGS